MSISSASMPIGATYTPTGGSATSLVAKGSTSGSQLSTFLDDGSILLDQIQFDFSYSEPKVNSGAPGGWTQARNNVAVKSPLGLDNGNRTVNTIRIEISCDPETTDAEKATLREYGAHVLLDSDFTDFWDNQSTS